MELDQDKIKDIVKGNNRFLSAYSDPEPYFMYSFKKKIPDRELTEYYYDKLRYAVQNSEDLIKDMFRDEFYDFYGVKKTAVHSHEEMRDGLIFESFTVDMDDRSVAVYFSNPEFMFGHFIEVHWDKDWNLVFYWID